mgnify:CR=1 FL=1
MAKIRKHARASLRNLADALELEAAYQLDVTAFFDFEGTRVRMPDTADARLIWASVQLGLDSDVVVLVEAATYLAQVGAAAWLSSRGKRRDEEVMEVVGATTREYVVDVLRKADLRGDPHELVDTLAPSLLEAGVLVAQRAVEGLQNTS